MKVMKQQNILIKILLILGLERWCSGYYILVLQKTQAQLLTLMSDSSQSPPTPVLGKGFQYC